MEAKDLRLDNYINVLCKDEDGILINDNEPVRCNIYHLTDLIDGNDSWEYKPIPLTEEWLIKFGFIKFTTPALPTAFIETTRYIYTEQIEPFMDILMWDGQVFRFHNGHAIENIKYVHQLQNLVFTLTGKELTL